MAIFGYFLCILLLALVSSVLVKHGKPSKWKLPPSPPKLPIIGNLHLMRGLPHTHRLFHQLSKKYGPVMLLHLGYTPVVVISSSEAAAQVLKTHDLLCCSRPKTVGSEKFSYNGKDIGFAPYGEEWRELRKLAVLEFFSLKKVRSFRHVREEENNLMIKKLSESLQSPVDLSKTLFCLSASIIFRVTFGQSFLESKHIDKDSIGELMLEAQAVQRLTCSDFFPCFGWFVDWFSGQHNRIEKVFVKIDNLFDQVIDDHLKQGRTAQDQPGIVDMMLKIMDEQGQNDCFRFTIDHIKGVISDIFLAGVDTSAITMIWAMTELARRPKAMRKVQDEVRSIIGKKETVTEDDLDQLHYLKLVIKETLRLHPAAPLLLPRETMAHVKIQGYDIPPKTCLRINGFAIARDPKHWKNPQDFIPERFIQRPVDYRGQHFELLPFGSGRRICPGMSMAIATVELGLLNLLYFFDWKLPDGMTEKDIDMEEAGNITIVKKAPLELVPVRHF